MLEYNIILNCFILVTLVASVWSRSSDSCGDVLTNREGVITSPNFPNRYPPYRRCIWKIEAPPESRITLNFTHFDLEEDIDCTYDFVQIFKIFGRSWESNLTPRYCGSELPPIFVSDDNFIHIEFQSDRSREENGFSVLYSIDDNMKNFVYTTQTAVPYTAETDLYISETESTPSESPYTVGSADKTGPCRSNSNAGSAVVPFPNRQLTRETSVSNTERDPKYLPTLPKNYVDISIKFPFIQRLPVPNKPLSFKRKSTQNQGMGFVLDNGKDKSFSDQFEQDYDRFSADTQMRDVYVGKLDEELPLRYAGASYKQNDYVPGPLMALFLFSNSHSVKIRVNDEV